jgi:translin family protein
VQAEIETISKLAKKASEQAYYRWNSTWTRSMQDVVSTILLVQWLKTSTLITIEEVGEMMDVPVNLKDRDDFHLTIEEYLLALVSLIEELVGLSETVLHLTCLFNC